MCVRTLTHLRKVGNTVYVHTVRRLKSRIKVNNEPPWKPKIIKIRRASLTCDAKRTWSVEGNKKNRRWSYAIGILSCTCQVVMRRAFWFVFVSTDWQMRPYPSVQCSSTLSVLFLAECNYKSHLTWMYDVGSSYSSLSSRLVQAVILLTCIRKVSGSILGQDVDSPTDILRGFPQSQQANTGIIYQVRARPFPSTSIPIQHLLIIVFLVGGSRQK
jgi:hypothetical protein